MDSTTKSASRVLLLASAVIVSLGAASTPAAFAQDKMGKERMAKDTMSKDGMKKDDSMSKDAMTPTDIEQANIDLIRRHFADFVDRKDVTAAERNFAADFIDHNPPGGTKTIAEGMALARRVYQRFPDMRCELRDVLAQGDKVAVRAVWSGHDAESGQLMEFHGFTLWRFRGDKMVERWATTTDLRPVGHDDPIW